MLRVQRRSAIVARTQAANQLHAVVDTAPEPLRTELRALSLSKLIAQARAMVTQRPTDLTSWTRQILHGLACLWGQLDHEVQQVDAIIVRLSEAAAPQMLALRGVGPEAASTLLVAAGGCPQRLEHEASFGAVRRLAGGRFVGPTASSRLNRGGNRDANRALWGHRAGAPALRPADSRVCSPADAAKAVQSRDFALPQSVHRPRNFSHPALAKADSHPRSDACGFGLNKIGASTPRARGSSARSKRNARRRSLSPSKSPPSWNSTSPASTTRSEGTPARAT